MRTALLIVLATSVNLAAPPETDEFTDAPQIQRPWTTLPTMACGDLFIAPVSINGSAPVPMLLDTGASITSLAPDVAKRAGVEDYVETLRIGSFRVAGRIRHQVRDLGEVSQAIGSDIKGIVSYTVFSELLLTFDYPRREVRVATGDLPMTGEGIVPIAEGPRPYLGALVDGGPKPLLIDTGAVGGLQLDELGGLAFAVPPKPCRASMRIDGLRIVEMGRLSADIRFGPVLLETPIVADAAGTSLLGTEILRHFAVTFDQRAGRVRFERPDAPLDEPIVSPPYYSIGVAFRPIDDALVAERVFEGSTAGSAGLLDGDRVTAINGVDVDALDCQHGKGSAATPGELRLSIDRNGDTLELTVPLAEVIP